VIQSHRAPALRTLILAAAMGAMLAGPVAAQSLTSIQGLGYPVLATDARTEALGGLGLGLQGLSAPMTNPAAAAGLLRRGAIVSVSAVEQTATWADESGSFGATRFPLIQVIYPIRGVVVTAGYGGYLDQSWGVERSGDPGRRRDHGLVS
jgi:hypothetical protein